MSSDVFDYEGRLGDLFPWDDADSPWFLRLAILRDDIAHEMEGLVLPPEASERQVWRCSYALRRLALIVGEVKNILVYEVSSHLKSLTPQVEPEAIRQLGDCIQQVSEAYVRLKPIRDALGGHVRPESSLPKSDGTDPTALDPKVLVPLVLQTHDHVRMVLRVDAGCGRNTSFRPLTTHALLFVWPDVETLEDLSAKHAQLSDDIFKCFNPIVQAIDILFYLRWMKLGVRAYEVPPELLDAE